MQRKTKKIVLALVVIGVVAAGGAAFTAANTVPDTVAGYGTSTVSGTVVTSIHHHLITNGTEISDTTMVLSGDQTGTVVKAGFDITGAVNVTCVPGVWTPAAAPNDTDKKLGTTPVTCTYPVGPAAGFVSTTATSSFTVAVSS